MKKQLSSYQRAQVTGASQQELILMCYRGAIQYLKDAQRRLQAGEIDEFSELLEKAHRVIFHLYTTLDMERGGEIAEKLADLYSYLINQLYLLNATKKQDIFDGVIRVMENLKEGWEGIGQENTGDQTAGEQQANNPELASAQATSVSVQI
jgi:flagellar protein FliS